MLENLYMTKSYIASSQWNNRSNIKQLSKWRSRWRCTYDDNSESNSEDYLACSSDENETDAEEDYLEQNTVICEQLSADHEYSELQ